MTHEYTLCSDLLYSCSTVNLTLIPPWLCARLQRFLWPCDYFWIWLMTSTIQLVVLLSVNTHLSLTVWGDWCYYPDPDSWPWPWPWPWPWSLIPDPWSLTLTPTLTLTLTLTIDPFLDCIPHHSCEGTKFDIHNCDTDCNELSIVCLMKTETEIRDGRQRQHKDSKWNLWVWTAYV